MYGRRWGCYGRLSNLVGREWRNVERGKPDAGSEELKRNMSDRESATNHKAVASEGHHCISQQLIKATSCISCFFVTEVERIATKGAPQSLTISAFRLSIYTTFSFLPGEINPNQVSSLKAALETNPLKFCSVFLLALIFSFHVGHTPSPCVQRISKDVHVLDLILKLLLPTLTIPSLNILIHGPVL